MSDKDRGHASDTRVGVPPLAGENQADQPTSAKPEGLRERKKRKTRDAIQRHALRLFDEQGFHETTVEEIAEAAEISPSTFYRYFPTKEDTVTYDAFDPVLVEAYLRQPAEFGALRAARVAIAEAYTTMPGESSRLEQVRQRLMLSIPELRGRMMDQFVKTTRVMAEAIAQRAGRSSTDPAVVAWAGATIGAGLAAFSQLPDYEYGSAPVAELAQRMDVMLAELEAGCDL